MLLFVRSNEVHFRVKHWDVNNENLHGDFYERHTGNPNITMQMFRDIHHVDQNVKLFLNEFGIVEGGNGNVATVSKGLHIIQRTNKSRPNLYTYTVQCWCILVEYTISSA